MSASVANKNGVLLINLGTPDAPTVSAVRRYLREFLNDPRVIDLPTPFRKLLVDGVIAPFRPFKTLKAYQSIWLESGSPLLVYSKRFADKLQAQLGEHYHVELAMRYGNPSIDQAVQRLNEAYCERIHILPLFPQYSSAASGSAIEAALKALNRYSNLPHLICHREFYHQPGYIKALSHSIQQSAPSSTDFYLFSYHGIPERQIERSESNVHCDRLGPCPKPSGNNRFCYRAQCYETTRLVADRLGLDEHQYGVSFQSRLGRTPWIQPYTDFQLPRLYERGIRRLTIVCPSFTADCLETLEEIGIQAKEQWSELGGAPLNLVPCLNDDQHWVAAMAEVIHTTCG